VKISSTAVPVYSIGTSAPGVPPEEEVVLLFQIVSKMIVSETFYRYTGTVLGGKRYKSL
jgi:hypothetical protein